MYFLTKHRSVPWMSSWLNVRSHCPKIPSSHSSPFFISLSLSEIVLMRDLSDGPRASFPFYVFFLFAFASIKTIIRSVIGRLRPVRQLSVIHVVISRSLDDVSIFICSQRNSGISSGKEENNYRCNSVVSWGQHSLGQAVRLMHTTTTLHLQLHPPTPTLQ
jgi:hypothetical protein